MINESGLDFKDISSENRRVYQYADGKDIVIDGPLALNVSSSGGHRLLDCAGISHYIPSGWRHLSWVCKKDQPHFVK